jgi:hypothetical protein
LACSKKCGALPVQFLNTLDRCLVCHLTVSKIHRRRAQRRLRNRCSHAWSSTVGIPFYIGSVAGAGVAAIGLGATAAATVAGAVLGGVAGAGLGAVLAGAVIRRRAEQVKEQLAEGGMVLWVSLGDADDADAERCALQILRKAGARDIHVHEFAREWTPKDRPFSEVQFDPFLWWPGDRGQE